MNINKILTICLLYISLSSCQKNPYQQGQRIYKDLCSNCHNDDGTGLGKIIPKLGVKLKNKPIGTQVCLILNGIRADSIGLTEKAMPGYPKIKPVNLTNLINYINFEWNQNQFEEHSIKDIKPLINSCK